MNPDFCIARRADGSVLIGPPQATVFLDINKDQLKDLYRTLINLSRIDDGSVQISFPDPFRVDPERAQAMVKALFSEGAAESTDRVMAGPDEAPGAATPEATPNPLETSTRFLGISIVRHRRRGHERVTLYFPREIRALDVSPEEAKELAAKVVALAELPREVVGDVSSEMPDLSS